MRHHQNCHIFREKPSTEFSPPEPYLSYRLGMAHSNLQHCAGMLLTQLIISHALFTKNTNSRLFKTRQLLFNYPKIGRMRPIDPERLH